MVECRATMLSPLPSHTCACSVPLDTVSSSKPLRYLLYHAISPARPLCSFVVLCESRSAPRCCGLFLHGFVRWGAGSHSRFKRDLHKFLYVWNLVGEYPVLDKIKGYFFISVGYITKRSKRCLINYVHKRLSYEVF